jgi:N-acetylmuramic acid 6-phosphate etherase
MQGGGRLFYIGAGTSGRLGILDASEIPPTYGVEDGLVVGIIAGGDNAIRNAIEFAEDDNGQAWIDLNKYQISSQDFLIGIAASGETPYVLGGIAIAKQKGISTGCIVCNGQSSIAKVAEYPIELITGPEFVTGSTRMKAGTAQKMTLNIISTSLMIQLGKVKGNRMMEMKLSNDKLNKRAIHILMQELNISNGVASGSSSGRYFALVFDNMNASGGSFVLSEIQVIIDGVSQTLGAASASIHSTSFNISGNLSNNSFANDASNYGYSTTVPAYIIIDLGEIKSIDGLAIGVTGFGGSINGMEYFAERITMKNSDLNPSIGGYGSMTNVKVIENLSRMLFTPNARYDILATP